MLVLGVSSISPFRDYEDMDPDQGWALHDAAAVLVEDGRVLAAIEEERLNRVKHSSAFPARAIRRCLEQAGVGLADVDRVAVAFSEPHSDAYFLRRALENASLPLGGGRAQVARLLHDEFGVDTADRMRFVGHHDAHLWSAFQPSGFARGLVVSIDGAGDNLSGAIATFEGTRLEMLRELPMSKSLGFFYRECITMVGYTRFDEYKVMGLAPYGDPSKYAELFAQTYRLLPDGDYELAGKGLVRLMARAGLADHARRKGQPFNQDHRDFAAALQQALERIVFHVLTHFQAVTGERSLCLAGGVAHNCSCNGRIAYSGLFDQVWVQPAAHDAGNALGAALAVLHQEGAPLSSEPLRQVYLGTGIPDEAQGVERQLRGWDGLVSFQHHDDVAREAARLMADGAVIGWVQGRSEFGPRALGNRSILADPRPAENKDRINAMVKKREGYRPFAPSARLERAGEYFELPAGSTEFPFMTFALRVRPEARELLGAVTHVDGTARVQTVARDTSPRYWALLRAFEELTGVAVLLNTSFNNHAEPIVDSVDEAVTCFLTTGLDALVVGDHLVRKRHDAAGSLAVHLLSPSIPSSRKLAMRTGRAGAREYSLDSTGNRWFGEQAVALSADAFAVLLAADGERTLDELLATRGLSEARRGEVLEEMAELWSRRVVSLRPPAVPDETAESAAPSARVSVSRVALVG